MKPINIILRICLLLCGAFLFTRCAPEVVEPELECIPYIDGMDAFLAAPRDPFTFKEAKIEGDCLQFLLAYGGGCGTIAFNLHYIGELNGNQAKMVLSFDDNDSCESLLEEERYFDLSNLQLEDSSLNELELTIEGYNQTLVYSF